jgi:hypothetical protein
LVFFTQKNLAALMGSRFVTLLHTATRIGKRPTCLTCQIVICGRKYSRGRFIVHFFRGKSFFVDFFLRISSENSFSKLFSVENSYFPQHFMGGGNFPRNFFPD